MAAQATTQAMPLQDTEAMLSEAFMLRQEHSAAAWAQAWARMTAVRVYLALTADPQVSRSERLAVLRALARHLGTSEAHLRRLAREYFFSHSITMFLPKKRGDAAP